MSESVSSPRRESIERSLHRSYWRGSSFAFWISRRIRPAGYGLVVALATASVLGVGHPRNPVYLIFSFALAFVLISLPWAWFRKAGSLEIRREAPRHATVGEQVRYPIRVTRRGNAPLRTAWFQETPPDPRPSADLFVHSREPDEATRNAYDRFFAFYRWRWLLERRRLFFGGDSDEPFELAAEESSQVLVSLTPLRRGVIRLDDLRVLLPDPFGFFQSCVPVPAPPVTITVLPRRYSLPPLELPGSGRFQIGGEESSNSIGSSGEFIGLRDYRPGDPLRQIHWKSWARAGRPIVKELENTYFPRYGLVLDTFPAAGSEESFEELISIAASFAATLDMKETLLDLMFVGERAHRVTAGRGIAKAEKLLEVLAAVEPEGASRFEGLAKLVLRYREELTSCLILFCGWSAERAEFLKRLSSQGLPCAVIACGPGAAPDGYPGIWVESGQLARDLAKLPIRLPSVG